MPQQKSGLGSSSGPDRGEDTMFTGLMPAMVTNFDERGELDLAATEAVVERLIEAGVDGISPLGSTGEASHLASEERMSRRVAAWLAWS